MNNIYGKKILVIGDAMLDQYRFGDVRRISPEAPVPVFKEKGAERLSPGGASNVAVNIAAIGIETYLCAVVGDDENGRKLRNLLHEKGVNVDFLIEDNQRVTTKKLRYMGPNNQQMLRVDTEDDTVIPQYIQDEVVSRINDRISEFNLILVSDYAKGMLSDQLTQRVISLANENNVPVFIDVKGISAEKYKEATLLKPNRKELADLSGKMVETIEQAANAAILLCRDIGCKYVLTTLGSDGMILTDDSHLISHISSTANEIYDVTGAGDTSFAYLAAEYVMGKSIENAMNISNIAAGIQVSRVGTCVIDPRDVMKAVGKMVKENDTKQESFEEVLSEIEDCRKQGGKIVFTNGCFDIIHAGHVTYLMAAKKLGDYLVIGLNDDESVRRLKGKDRPVNTLKDRKLVLESLNSVDYVIPFSEDTPFELIKKITPDILVKGGDYKVDNIVGADYVRENGGTVEVIPFLEGHSTTDTIAKIQNR